MSQFDKMVQLLDAAWPAKDMIVPCLIGPVGIGKTAAVHEHAKNVGAGKVVTFIASQILPNEVSGITMPVHETKSMEIFDHARLSSLEDGDILFFDELFEGPQHVLSACLTLIESRMMMSGKQLPDIQIIAATNPTVMPAAIKPSIRQRFMFSNFEMIPGEATDYVKDVTGLNVSRLNSELTTDSNDEYNFLSPRSLTKLAEWMCRADNVNEAKKITNAIAVIWGYHISDVLFKAWNTKHAADKEQLAKEKLIEVAFGSLDREHFDMSMDEIVGELKKSGEWEATAEKLASIDIEDL